MKHLITSLFVLLLCCNFLVMNAQESNSIFSNAKIGLSFSSVGSNNVFRVNELIGASSYDSKSFYTIGLVYVKGLNNFIELETGIEFSKHKIMVSSPLFTDIDMAPREDGFSLINIPVTLRVNFLKYFFINGGLLLDIDASANSSIDSQSGIGAIFGVAAKYDFGSGLGVFVNPYSKIHSLLPFADMRYHQRVWENGFRFGVTYQIR